LDPAEFRRDAKPKIELSKITVLLKSRRSFTHRRMTPVHDTIRSDQLTDETGSIMSPKRRTPRPFREEAGSAFQRDTNILRLAISSNKILHISTKFFGFI
jgi:hypothetical protein